MKRISIPGLQGYMVDEAGTVWSSHKGRFDRWSEPHIIKPYKDKRGYMHVTLRPAGLKKRFSVHVLVAVAFIGERPSNANIAHIDGDPSNNALTNLAYVSQKENINHRWAHGTMIFGEQSHLSKVDDKEAKEIWEAINRGASNKEIMKQFGVSKSYPAAMRAGRIRKHITGIGLIH